MDEKIEITEKAVRKSAEQERAFVDMLNQEMKELQDSMQEKQIEEMAEVMNAYFCGGFADNRGCCFCESITNRCDACKQVHFEVCENYAETLYNAGYRKESDTAREILGLILAKEFEKGDYLTDDELHELFKERYGVEVE